MSATKNVGCKPTHICLEVQLHYGGKPATSNGSSISIFTIHQVQILLKKRQRAYFSGGMEVIVHLFTDKYSEQWGVSFIILGVENCQPVDFRRMGCSRLRT